MWRRGRRRRQDVDTCGGGAGGEGRTLTRVAAGQEANRRRDKQKSVLMRLHEPIFAMAVEMHERSRWVPPPPALSPLTPESSTGLSRTPPHWGGETGRETGGPGPCSATWSRP